ncbi:MAG: hypothetical protein NWE99_08115 [Candidatus Bathyarchaeota archaeon]|nr:hypothetical protein [Candidatus Bathyarchaeota archaeon]
MAAPLQPEFFLLLGIDLFLAMSLLTCLLDKHFPWHLPYLYQVASLAGFGQLIVAKEFMALFGDYMRFWFSLLYLAIALANIAAVNVYLGIIKKMLAYAKVFMLAVSFPSFAVVSFFLANYSSVASHPLVMFPHVAWEATFVGVVAFDTFVIGAGTYLFFKPKWWHVALVGGAAIAGATAYAFFKPTGGTSVFVVSAIALALACIFVLATSVYILVRIWKETRIEKDRKRR